jgi:hypothetical protein
MTTQFVGIREFRQNMAAIAAIARKKNRRLIILRKNMPIFELRPLNPSERRMAEFLRSIAEAEGDIKAGRTYTTEQVMKSLGL